MEDDAGATLVGPTAEGAGLTAEAVRIEAARRRRASLGGAASGAPPRRREPEPKKRRFPVKSLIAMIVIAGIVAAGIVAARQVYFLGTDEGGRIALYRGLPYDLPLGIELYSEVTSSPTQVASLPEDRRDEATDHDLRSKDDAADLLDDLEAAVATSTTPIDTGQSGTKNDVNGNQKDDQGGDKKGGHKKRPVKG